LRQQHPRFLHENPQGEVGENTDLAHLHDPLFLLNPSSASFLDSRCDGGDLWRERCCGEGKKLAGERRQERQRLGSASRAGEGEGWGGDLGQGRGGLAGLALSRLFFFFMCYILPSFKEFVPEFYYVMINFLSK